MFVCWNLGTLIGALAGSAIDPQTYGLDAAFPAGFVAMVAPQLRQPPGLLAGVLGAHDLPRADPVHAGRGADPVQLGGGARRHPRPPPAGRVDPRHRGRAVTWTLVLGVGRRRLRLQGRRARRHRLAPAAARVERCLALVPAALISALVVKNTFSTGNELVLDARAAGVAAAAIAAWRRAPLIVVIVLGAAVTALVRQVA